MVEFSGLIWMVTCWLGILYDDLNDKHRDIHGYPWKGMVMCDAPVLQVTNINFKIPIIELDSHTPKTAFLAMSMEHY